MHNMYYICIMHLIMPIHIYLLVYIIIKKTNIVYLAQFNKLLNHLTMGETHHTRISHA